MSATRAVLVALLCLLLTTGAWSQAVPSSVTAPIVVSLLVTEPGGRAVTGLQLKDFRVLEDQVPQTILSVKANSLAGDYTLTYTPKNLSNQPAFRKVQVEIVGPVAAARLTVKHAAGYFNW